jgi:hypothetical protein
MWGGRDGWRSVIFSLVARGGCRTAAGQLHGQLQGSCRTAAGARLTEQSKAFICGWMHTPWRGWTDQRAGYIGQARTSTAPLRTARMCCLISSLRLGSPRTSSQHRVTAVPPFCRQGVRGDRASGEDVVVCCWTQQHICACCRCRQHTTTCKSATATYRKTTHP